LEFQQSTTSFSDDFSGGCVGNAKVFLDLKVLCGLEVSLDGLVVVIGGAEVVVGCWYCHEVVGCRCYGGEVRRWCVVNVVSVWFFGYWIL
jgi:hypothetical protein